MHKESIIILYNMKFIVDNRERKIIENLSKQIPDKYELQNLQIGDFIFEVDNTPLVIIERKTIQDLASSIKDCRYKEQKMRLLNEKNKGVQIIYLLEGDIDVKTGGIPASTFTSVIINSMVRDGIYTYISKNVETTCNILIKIYKLIESNKTDLLKQQPSTLIEYASCIKKNKKENLTPLVCYINQLSQIPGVSTTIATAISEKYPTMLKLINELEVEEGDTIKDIKYGNSKRKIGNIVSARIYNYLCSVNTA